MTVGHNETPEELALVVPVQRGLLADLELLGEASGRVPGAYAREVLRQHVYGMQRELALLRGGHDETR